MNVQVILLIFGYSSNERKQRQIYRGEVLGQLPFDLKNMDDPVPAMEITSTGTTIGGYSIERTDIMSGCLSIYWLYFGLKHFIQYS